MLALEHEHDLLYAALMQAWRGEAYTDVVRLVVGLAHIVGRLNNPASAEQILRMGIEASQHLQDKQHEAYFLNRLGGLLFSHGGYEQGGISGGQDWN